MKSLRSLLLNAQPFRSAQDLTQSSHALHILSKDAVLSCFAPLDAEAAYPDLSGWIFLVNTQLLEHENILLSMMDEEKSTSKDPWTFLPAMWSVIALELRSGISTLDSILAELLSQSLLPPSCRSSKRCLALTWIHIILGLQTMLYQPSSLSPSLTKFMIRDELKFEGQGIMSCHQDYSNTGKPIYRYLIHFGVMLPPPRFDLGLSSNDLEKALPVERELRPSFINAKLLINIAHVKFRWTDSIACHLEFNSNTRELFLFRHPSFCIAGVLSKNCQTSIHGCARPVSDLSGQWATASEVTRLMKEVLMSYRLLFGLHRESRQLIPHVVDPWSDDPSQVRDLALLDLCTSAKRTGAILGLDKDVYDLTEDFPMLFGKLSTLQTFLNGCKPRTLKDIWRDKRDHAGWMTLWVVLIFGALALLLALAQVILTIIQIVLGR